MAKVFTITEGLENLGALKSGGQGSVYKARRAGQLVSAVKILPTPISSESDDDKNFISFQNEVEKLKKVNEVPNPNVISILSSGITSSGNLPFIEMEYVEGPDLAELLTPPHDAVFSIKETIKVARHLSNALAHCHRSGVKHGDIKSNNVKYNCLTGNYMLLDFGLAVMSDEQRRTSMRYAGAIEFMAPEQSAGETLFETDVYSFGVILFELLAGKVPFPLNNKGEMGRNAVMIAHMEMDVPDILSLRHDALPADWNNEKKQSEMLVPDWLLKLVETCLEKLPHNRFANGTVLQNFIREGILAEEKRVILPVNEVVSAIVVQGPLDDVLWKEKLQQLQALVDKHAHEVSELKYQVAAKDRELYQLNMELYNQPKRSRISRSAFITMLMLTLGLTGFALYKAVIKPYYHDTPVNSGSRPSFDSLAVLQTKTAKKASHKPGKNTVIQTAGEKKLPGSNTADKKESVSVEDMQGGNTYRIKNNAFFYKKPDKYSRTGRYVAANDETLTSLAEQTDFIYVEFTDKRGKINQTWLAKADLRLVGKR